MTEKKTTPYLGLVGAWALAFGCSVGWGSFVMPGGTFLPIAGPIGTAIGLGLGALVMMLLGANYHYLMNKFPSRGGTYTYTKTCFGYDHGFISAWFLILTYIAVLWANATALPLIARTVLGDIFQFGFEYEIAGFHVYMGEILLAEAAILISAALCLSRKFSILTQIVMAFLLIGGVVICFAAVEGHTPGSVISVKPAYSPDHSAFGGTFTIFALAPWAYVGFESISHSAAESKYSMKKAFPVFAVALITAGLAYVLLALMAASTLPEGCSSWTDYIAHLGDYEGVTAQPTFFAAFSAMGSTGKLLLGAAALGGISTGVLGNFIALSRLLTEMAWDDLLPDRFGELDKNESPRFAIFVIMAVSLVLPFFGRTAISWIVDVTTVGATIAYAFASAAAYKTASAEKSKLFTYTGGAGLIISVVFVLFFLIPNITSVKTLATESYLILAAWSILGFIYFRFVFSKDKAKRLGRSTVAWVVLLATIILTSSIWLLQTAEKSVEQSVAPIQEYYMDQLEEAGIDTTTGATQEHYQYLDDTLTHINETLNVAIIIQVLLIVVSLLILFDLYSQIQKRERQAEIEKALAEETSRAKTSFLSNMSHEIRTPMNAIIGLDSIALRDPDLSPKTKDELEKIGASAKHLLALINDILDMSRIESGRMIIKDEEFSFREFLEQVNVIINGQCADKGLTYDTEIADGLADFYIGDDMRLKQVIINILGNSVKFTEAPGTVSLKVEEAERTDDRCRLKFTLSDTGIGMSEEFLPTIFESFSQENATNTNKYGGSGLGMAITKNFVELMGGEVSVASTKGVGTTFTVIVPLGISAKTEAEAKAELEAASAVDSLLAGCRVLMAEDVDMNAEILEDLLELEDIGAEHAGNGKVALDMFTESPEGYYDAILMDVRMPVLDGLETTKAIRKLDRSDADVPIIAMTANVFYADIMETREAGMDAHLAKPIEPEKLYRTLAEQIAEHRNKTKA